MLGESATTRFLAGYDVKVDYSMLAVMVCTLGLILIVEITRHYIDHKAERRPFFKAVLTSVYSELSTLGIVEAAIYVLHSYYAGLDVPKEKVFAYCHFLLFFTAIFNALQSAIQAFFALRVSNRLWVRTEELELHHYVAIREEFEDLERVVRRLKPDRHGMMSFCDEVVSKLHRLGSEIANPYIFRKYRRLLVQVRFHELRVHFLQANALPLKLKVSEYLQRSEIALLQRLTCVSAFAWILLTGATNFTYYMFGMIIYGSEAGNEPASRALAYMYIGGNVFFALLSVVIYYKMTVVFNKIMKMKFIDVGVTTTRMDIDQYADMRKRQLALFWGESPSYIVGIIQFMQFGYAISAAILIIFWQKLEKDAFVPPSDLLITLAVCYSVYVLVVAEVIPKYTMCTSLGALVDRKRLKEMTTKYKLEEAVLASTAATSVEDTFRGKTVSESDDSSTISKLSNIAELVQTKTDELRSSRNLTFETRKSQRKKAFSDSRSIAMMRLYGSSNANTFQETESVPEGEPKMITSSSYLDLSIASADHSAMPSGNFEIEGNPENPLPVEVSLNHQDIEQQGTVKPASVPTKFQMASGLDEASMTSVKTFKERLLSILFSKPYRLLNELFGTMIAFFLVGMRVEVLILESKEIKDLETTFHLTVEAAFTFLVTWLCLLITLSSIILAVSDEHHLKHRLASSIDVVLGLVSLILLLVAEAQRCCDDASDYGCCGPFGSRTYGGLGNIEPFTSIIGLRVFRYFAARKLLLFMHRTEDQDDDDESVEIQQVPEPLKEDMVELQGNIVHLWQHAVSLYPQVVAEEGEFSGALLKAMLGINVEGPGRRDVTSTTKRVLDTSATKSVGSTGLAQDLDTDAAIGELVAPDGVLILPMRRCDWMLPPFVDHWRTVDVVITDKEIVILEAIDVNDMDVSTSKMNRLNGIWRSIGTTKGGVGMRLRDMVVGRKVLGHVDMTSIDSLNVERYPAFFCSGGAVVALHGDDYLREEYWSSGVSAPDQGARTARWKAICEDQLKIHSIDSSTYLRFHHDLKLKEQDNEASLALISAFKWCKAIGRVRGSHNLAQKLPHFRHGDDMEFLDYVHVTTRGSGEENHRRVNKIESWVKKVASHAKPTLHRSTSSNVDDHTPNLSRSSSANEKDAGASKV